MTYPARAHISVKRHPNERTKPVRLIGFSMSTRTDKRNLVELELLFDSPYAFDYMNSRRMAEDDLTVKIVADGWSDMHLKMRVTVIMVLNDAIHANLIGAYTRIG